MAEIENSEDPSIANLGKCKDVLLEAFDNDTRAVLVVQLSKKVMVRGYSRDYVGVVIEDKQIEQLARALMRVAKRKSTKISLAMPGPRLVKPVRLVR